MATFYGTTVQNFRAYGEYTVTDHTTYVTISLVGGMQSVAWGFDVGYVDCTATVNGQSATTTNNSFYSANGATVKKQMASKSVNVNKASSAKNVTVSVTVYNHSGYHDGTSTATASVNVPALPVELPNAPSSLTATYVSDSSATLSWTNGATDSTHPRTATVVERQTDGGSWVQIASAGSSAANYTDNGISANHSYEYRVAASNSAGLSSYATSSAIYTTPSAPTSVTLDKTSATAVTVDVTGSMPYATGFDVQSTYDNGATWSTDATGTSMPYAATVGAGTVIFRVRSTRGALESAWTQSTALVTITPPLAPTITQAPANPTAYGDSDTISWTPNHPDGSSQESAEIKVTNPGGTSTTYTVNGMGTSYTLTPNAAGTWTAQVRTKGLDATMGEWSQAVSWTVANPPAVAITNPATDGATVTVLPLAIAWTVTDGTGVSAQRLVIEDVGGTELLNRTLAANATSASLTASDIALVNGESYAIKLRVMGGSGLVTVQTRTFNVSWIPPAEPVLAIYEGDGSSASIDVTFGEDTLATNLTPFFSHDLTDVYNSSTNPTGYWREMTSGYTMLDDGWVNFTCDNTGSGSNANRAWSASPLDSIVAGDTYTFLVEVRNVTSTMGTAQTENFVIPCYSAYQLNTSGSVKFGDETDADYHAYHFAVTGNDPSSVRLQRGRCYVYAGGYLSLDFRISLYEGEYDGEYVRYGIPATDSVDVLRVNADGTTWTVATDLSDGASCIDPLPPLGVPVEYRAVASAASGATATASFTETLGGRDWTLNFGNAAQESISLRYNPDASYALVQGGTSYHFADGGAGGGRPVFYPTTDRDESGGLKFATIGSGDADRLRDLCDRYPVAWLRDPFGHRWRARVKPSWTHGVGQLWPLSIGWDAVRWEEAW